MVFSLERIANTRYRNRRLGDLVNLVKLATINATEEKVITNENQCVEGYAINIKIAQAGNSTIDCDRNECRLLFREGSDTYRSSVNEASRRDYTALFLSPGFLPHASLVSSFSFRSTWYDWMHTVHFVCGEENKRRRMINASTVKVSGKKDFQIPLSPYRSITVPKTDVSTL